MFQPDGAGTAAAAARAAEEAATPAAGRSAGGSVVNGSAQDSNLVPATTAAAQEPQQEGQEADAPLAKRLPGAEWRERCGPMGIPADERRSSPIVELSLLLVGCFTFH